MTTNVIVLDIETRADGALDSPELWQEKRDALSPPGNYKDMLKIEAWKDEQIEKDRARMALSATTGIIACIGVQTWEDDGPTVFCVEEENRDAERSMLLEHWGPWWTENYDPQETNVVTYNGRLFDMPFIAGRLMVHGISLSFPRARDYRRHIDLYDDVLGRDGKQTEWQLAMGGEGKQFDGKELLELSLPDLSLHCGEDIIALAAMAHRTIGIWGGRS